MESLYNRSRCFSFTTNNPTDDTYKKIINIPNKIRIKELIFQYQIGEVRKTPHFQGYIYCNDCHTKKRIIDLLKGSHIQIAENIHALKNYVQKVESKIGKEYYHFKNDVVISEYKNLTFILDPLLLDFTKDILKEKNLYPWQRDLEKIFLSKPDDRSIIIIYDEEGKCGKSSYTNYIDHKYPDKVFTTCGRPSDVKFMFSELIKRVGPNKIRMTIMDIPRLLRGKTQELSKDVFLTAEQFKNGRITSPKYESIVVRFAIHHFVIFTNIKPKRKMIEVTNKNLHYLTPDRWKIFTIKDKKLIKVSTEEIINSSED